MDPIRIRKRIKLSVQRKIEEGGIKGGNGVVLQTGPGGPGRAGGVFLILRWITSISWFTAQRTRAGCLKARVLLLILTSTKHKPSSSQQQPKEVVAAVSRHGVTTTLCVHHDGGVTRRCERDRLQMRHRLAEY